MTPESIADAFAGAAGCARGSQKCSGKSPAFDPNPISARTNAAARNGEARVPAWAAIARNDVLPAWIARMHKPARTQRAPPCATIRYVSVARRTLRRSCCEATRNAETNDISSHIRKKAATDRATKTPSIVKANRAMSAISAGRPRRRLHKPTAIESIASKAKNGAARIDRPNSKRKNSIGEDTTTKSDSGCIARTANAPAAHATAHVAPTPHSRTHMLRPAVQIFERRLHGDELVVEDLESGVEEMPNRRVADFVADRRALALRQHEVAGTQDRQLLRERRLFDAELVPKVADAQRTLAQGVQDTNPQRMGQ